MAEEPVGSGPLGLGKARGWAEALRGLGSDGGGGPTEAKRAQSPFSSAPEISVVSEQTLCWAVLVLSRSVVSDSL